MTQLKSRLMIVNILCLMLMFSVPDGWAMEPQDGDQEGNVLSDGKLTKEELAAAMLIAEKDLTGMFKAAMGKVESELEQSGIFGPGAWMTMKDRDLKSVKLSQEAVGAPPSAKLQMFRASLRSLARHNKIDAVLLVYPGTITKEGTKERVVVVEHEHRLGVSGIKLVPLDLDRGKATFGAPMSQDKDFQIFYEQRSKSKAAPNS